MIEIKLRNHLVNYEPLNDKIGTRLRPIKLGSGDDLPAGVYQKISSNEVYTHDGSTKLVTDRFQLSWIHKRQEFMELLEVIKIVKNRMNEFVEQDEIQSCFFEDENVTYEDDSDFVKIDLDYMISYIRSDL